MSTYDRILVVADWRADPHAVVAAVSRRFSRSASVFRVVVPAWLHGLDWIGDPKGSLPCAAAQAERLERLLRAAGVPVVAAGAGDASPVAAAGDALDGWPAAEVMLLADGARATTLFELSRRIERHTGLPTTRFTAHAEREARGGLRWIRRGGRHCAPYALRSA